MKPPDQKSTTTAPSSPQGCHTYTPGRASHMQSCFTPTCFECARSMQSRDVLRAGGCRAVSCPIHTHVSSRDPRDRDPTQQNYPLASKAGSAGLAHACTHSSRCVSLSDVPASNEVVTFQGGQAQMLHAKGRSIKWHAACKYQVIIFL